MLKENLRIVLASASPRRRQLLQAAGVEFEVKTADVDESGVDGPSPEKLVMARARLKAQASAAALGSDDPPALVIGADTVVVVDGDVLGKPENEADARRMLGRLSDRTHLVLTGLAIRPVGVLAPELDAADSLDAAPKPRRMARAGECIVAYDRTEVTMVPLTPELVELYAATGEPLDKAGAYGIQERGGLLVRRLVGDYFNVVGLPLALLRDMLSVFGVEPLRSGQD